MGGGEGGGGGAPRDDNNEEGGEGAEEDKGEYTIKGVTYLDGKRHEDKLKSNTPCQVPGVRGTYIVGLRASDFKTQSGQGLGQG